MIKKSAIVFGLTAVLLMTACTTKKGLPNLTERESGLPVESSMSVENPTPVESSISVESPTPVESSISVESPTPVESTKQEATYDIESVFDDPVIIQIMEGEIMPVEVRHGLGGEGGYSQDKSKDPEVIRAYIDAFRNLKIKEVKTDKNDFNYVMDAINDYIFILDEDSEVIISLDLNKYVIKDDKQYVFEHSKELSDLNELIAEVDPEP